MPHKRTNKKEEVKQPGGVGEGGGGGAKTTLGRGANFSYKESIKSATKGMCKFV